MKSAYLPGDLHFYKGWSSKRSLNNYIYFFFKETYESQKEIAEIMSNKKKAKTPTKDLSRILIADDNEPLAQSLEMELKDAGKDVAVAYNGREVLSVLEKTKKARSTGF